MLPVTLLWPLACALLCLFISRPERILQVVLVGGLAQLGIVAALLPKIGAGRILALNSQLMLDALSMFHLLLVSLVFALSSVYAATYFSPAVASGHMATAKARRFGVSWFVFLSSMVLVLVSNNVALLWVAMEATTLASAVLVGLEMDARSIHAAWNYLLLCSVGIALALLGTFFLCGQARAAAFDGQSPFLWTDLIAMAPRMHPGSTKLAFLFLLVGYGTKAGLAPMHTWLPDAHSQAPTPVSAVLSGVLLNCALYAVSRFLPVATLSGAGETAQHWMMFLGGASIVVGVVFLTQEHDLKRLFAFSSVKHIGIIATGLGMGAGAAALFHTLNHSLNKMLMFFCAGKLGQRHGTRDVRSLRGIGVFDPGLGVVVVLGTLALFGLPPFSPFMSELWLAQSGIQHGRILPVLVFLVAGAFALVGVLKKVLPMWWSPADKAIVQPPEHDPEWPLFVGPLLLLLILGLWMPAGLRELLNHAAAIVEGR